MSSVAASTRTRVPWQLLAPSALTVACLSVVGATAPGLEDTFGTGSAALSVVFAFQLIGALGGSLVIGALHHPLLRGRPASLITAFFLVAAGAAPSFSMLTAAMLFAGFGCFLINTRAQADVSHLAADNRGPALGAFHIWGAAGGLVFPLLVAAALGLGMPWRAGFWILAAIFAAYGAAALPSLETTHTAVRRARPPVSGPAWLAVTASSISVSLQLTFPLYLAALLVNEYGTTDAAGALGISIYSAGLLAARVAGTSLLGRFSLDLELRVTVVVAVAAYPLLALASSPAIVVVACTILAAGIGLAYPLSSTRAMDLIGDDRYASSLVFAFNSVAQIVIPGLVALLLLVVGLQEALVATGVLAGVMALAAVLSEPGRRSRAC